MTLSSQENQLVIDDVKILLPWPVLDAVELESKIFVLLDPNSYLKDQPYKDTLKQGAPAIKNLIAFSSAGVKLWEAEFPEDSDYYYKIVSSSPLIVNSFSSYRCEIDPEDGSIKRQEFLK